MSNCARLNRLWLCQLRSALQPEKKDGHASRSRRIVTIQYINPHNNQPLEQVSGELRDSSGSVFPIIGCIPRFCEVENYTSSFGRQWNKFQATQIDREGVGGEPSKERFFAETGWIGE